MKRLTLLIVLVAAGAGLIWAVVSYRRQPAEVQFVRVTRQAVHNSVPTNGKVEPIIAPMSRTAT